MERESQIQGMEWVFFYSLINIITVVSAKAVTHDASTIQLSSFLVHHITWMDNNINSKRILAVPHLPPEDWRRPSGQPQITWLKTYLLDLKLQKLMLCEANKYSWKSTNPEIVGCEWCIAVLWCNLEVMTIMMMAMFSTKGQQECSTSNLAMHKPLQQTSASAILSTPHQLTLLLQPLSPSP